MNEKTMRALATLELAASQDVMLGDSVQQVRDALLERQMEDYVLAAGAWAMSRKVRSLMRGRICFWTILALTNAAFFVGGMMLSSDSAWASGFGTGISLLMLWWSIRDFQHSGEVLVPAPDFFVQDDGEDDR